MEGSRNCLCLAAIILLLSLSNGEEMLRDTQSRQGGTPTSLFQRLFWPLVGPNEYISTLTDTKSEVAKQIVEVAKIRKSIKKYEKACKTIIEKCGNSEECDKECEGELENCRDEVVSCNTEVDNCRDGLIDCNEERNECQTNNEECTTELENCEDEPKLCKCSKGFICPVVGRKCLTRIIYQPTGSIAQIATDYAAKCAEVATGAVPWRHIFDELETEGEKDAYAKSHVDNCFGFHPDSDTSFFLYNTDGNCPAIYASVSGTVIWIADFTGCTLASFIFICEYPCEDGP